MPLQDEEQKLLTDLARPAGMLTLFGSRNTAGILERLGEIGTPLHAVWGVSERVWDRSDLVAEAAARALKRILARADAEDLLEMDRRARIRPMYFPVRDTERWARVQPNELARLETFGDSYPWLIGFASFQPSGYVRQEAVRRLRALRSGEEIRFLLLRLNDWVSVIRDEAEAAIAERLTSANARSFAEQLYLVLRLPEWLRSSRLDSYRRISALLTGPDLRPLLTGALRSPTKSLRVSAARLLGALPASELVEIAPIAADATDVGVRFWLLTVVLPKLDSPSRHQFLIRLVRDPVASLRGAAIRALSAGDPEAAESTVESGLWDRSPAVRDLCRFLLRKGGRTDLARIVREHLASATGTELAGSIAALGETGGADDSRAVLRYTTDERARVRASALRALARLDLKSNLSIVHERLLDAASSVSRVAREVLERNQELVDFDIVETMFRAAQSRHSRINLLALMTHSGRWRAVRFLLEASCAGDEISKFASEALARWVARSPRSFVAPSSEEWAAASAAFTRAQGYLPQKSSTEIAAQLRTWAPADLQ